MGGMIYQLYQSHADALAPLRNFARASLPMLKDARYGMNVLPSVRKMAAAMQVFALADLTHKRPAFGISSVKVGEKTLEVEEEVVHSTPFGNLLRFRKDGVQSPVELVVTCTVIQILARYVVQTEVFREVFSRDSEVISQPIG